MYGSGTVAGPRLAGAGRARESCITCPVQHSTMNIVVVADLVGVAVRFSNP